MILAIDIGNTNIVVGCIDEEKTYFIERVSTDRSKTELEYAIVIKNVLDIFKISPKELEGGIVCSVVPQITHIVKLAAEKILEKDVMVLGPGIKTGMNILMDNPAQVGSDLIADAVGAIGEYEPPMIIFDMGTATTVCVVDGKKNYIGGMILPGVRTSLDALTARAAQLSGIDLEAPKRVIGKNTIECMKSGIVYSNGGSSGWDIYLSEGWNPIHRESVYYRLWYLRPYGKRTGRNTYCDRNRRSGKVHCSIL